MAFSLLAAATRDKVSDMAFLEVIDLKLSYRTDRGLVRAVDGTSFTLEAGQALGIVGESGSGKSSLALALMRLLPRNAEQLEGSVVLDGEDVLYISEDQFRRRLRGTVISMGFQGAMNSLNPVMRVGHQIAEPLLVVKGVKKQDAYVKVREMLELVGLTEDIFSRYPHELSGGMKQRVVIAMALVQKPKLVILDEPTSALDVSVQAQIMNLLKRLKRELGLSLIFITHDIALASDVCDHVAVIYGGKIVEIGDIEGVLLRPSHPYTEKLLASMPKLHAEVRPEFIPGAPPDLVEPSQGCRFNPRCPVATDICFTDDPPPFTVEDGHLARCWLREG
jgi:peptide/nickel transport system ATP-binding protein